MSSWSAKLSKPVYPRECAPLYRLADARTYLAELPQEIARAPAWRETAALLTAAADAGSPAAIALATEALKLAVFREDHAELMPLRYTQPVSARALPRSRRARLKIA
jgi:hypothetical protein